MKNATVKTKPKAKKRLSREARDGDEVSKEIPVDNKLPEEMKPNHAMQLLPRVIRMKDAPRYLGMDRNRFNKEARPDLVEIPIGKQGIGFDRLELDAWFDAYKARNGRPGPHQKGDEPWDAKKRQDSSKGAIAGTSTKSSKDSVFAKALAQITLKKPKGS